jgi:5-hydroxyisourate hydrolase
MGKLTTHVLDTANGRPAAGVRLVLSRLDGEARIAFVEALTNPDGRTDATLLEGDAFCPGIYELAFHTGAYFAGTGPHDPLAFLDVIPLRFGVQDASSHYHVPLLVTPWSFSTYRGS